MNIIKAIVVSVVASVIAHKVIQKLNEMEAERSPKEYSTRR